jgi:alpha-D-ribose 1-methylphosphonate 5-triphosphate synthase subunit PhnH
MNPIDSSEIQPGLGNPVHDAQAIFRQCLTAMSEPGKIEEIELPLITPTGLEPASYALALAIFDQQTELLLTPSLLTPAIEASLRFHCMSPIGSDLSQADFIVCNEDERPNLDSLKPGSDEYPDESCTLIIQCDSLQQGPGWIAQGPGIPDRRPVHCSALTPLLIEQRREMQPLFPLGIDLILCSGNQFMCLPRTTLLEEEIH